jgi:hypothetical protein
MQRLVVLRNKNLAHAVRIRVRHTTLSEGVHHEMMLFLKVIAVNPKRDTLLGPYLTPLQGWEDKDVRVRLYRLPRAEPLDLITDMVHSDHNPHGTIRTDDGYYPRDYLAPVPPPTTRTNLERAWRTITRDTTYKAYLKEIAAVQKEHRRLVTKTETLVKRKRGLITAHVNTLLMCNLQSFSHKGAP